MASGEDYTFVQCFARGKAGAAGAGDLISLLPTASWATTPTIFSLIRGLACAQIAVMESELLELVYRNEEDLYTKAQRLLRQGVDPNEITEYGESPLRVTSNRGRFDVVRLLLDNGADPSQLEWTDIFFAVAFSSVEEVDNLLHTGPDLSARDYWERTPWLVALQTGDVEKARLLLDAGAEQRARGRCGKTPLAYAVERDHVEMLRWLLSQGEDIEGPNDGGDTPLITAAVEGAKQCVSLLIASGANVFAQNDIPYRAIEQADDLEVVKLLLEAGENINDIAGEMRSKLTGLDRNAAPKVSPDEYLRARHRRFGRSNPEPADEPFWQYMIRTRESAYQGRAQFEGGPLSKEPVWCFDRFGMSITPLGDGRFIEIAGEHEDSYDPDFCIYNDVFVHDGDGHCQIYLYPREAFPPTDFHSATLVGDKIWIIGNLGYPEDRRSGHTPVYTLDVETMVVERAETTGEAPGWIGSHRAQHAEHREIVVRGGSVFANNGGKSDWRDNDAVFSLSLASLQWTRLQR